MRKLLTNINSTWTVPKIYSSTSECLHFLEKKISLKSIYFHCSYVFWFGDLNFRLIDAETTTPSDIEEMVKEDRLEELIQGDELSVIRRQGRAFTQLQERVPAFPPTFKYEPGTSDYNLK